MDASRAVDAVDLTKRFGDLVAVDAVSLAVEHGEVYGLLGPNGAGKTTFLRMLFGLIRPDAGTLELFGRSWPEHGNAVLDGVAGFVESPRFYPYLSGRANLEGLARLDGGRSAERIDRVLDTVDLTARAGDRVGGYSFGMRQRLGIAASLLRNPRLLVLDEPANGLDPAGIRDMRALVKRLAESGLTVLLSSHDMAEVEEICDNVTIMRRGSVVYHGGIAELRQQAPAQGYRVRTDDDDEALAIAAGRRELDVARHVDGGLLIRGSQGDVDALASDLIRAGLALRGLEHTEAPLETLFFMLTEPGDDEAPGASDDLTPIGAAR